MLDFEKNVLFAESQEDRLFAASRLPSSTDSELFSLVLSDPSPQVRLVGSQALRLKLLSLSPSEAFTEFTKVIESFDNPWTQTRDPRLDSDVVYDPARSRVNVALGALRAIQLLWNSVPIKSEFHLGFATAFQNAGFVGIMKDCVDGSDNLLSFVKSGFRFTPVKGNGWLPNEVVNCIRRSAMIAQTYALFFDFSYSKTFWGKGVHDAVCNALKEADITKLLKQQRTASGIVLTASLTLHRMFEAGLPCSSLSAKVYNSVSLSVGKPSMTGQLKE